MQRRKFLITGLSAVAIAALDVDISLAKKGFFWLSTLSNAPNLSVSTKAPNGDSLPISVAGVPSKFPTDGLVQPGDLLISNNADTAGLANQGSTIMRISPTGDSAIFFTGKPGMGLRRGLVALSQGFVLVASEPVNGQSQAGSLLVIDRHGKLVTEITDGLINGPNALIANEESGRNQIFISNARSGDLVKLDLRIVDGVVAVKSIKKMAGGLAEVTGLSVSGKGDLWLADGAHNSAAVLDDAINLNRQEPKVVYTQQGIAQPRGLVIAPNGNLLVLNGEENSIIEFTRDGKYAGRLLVFASQPGGFNNMSLVSFEGKPTLALTKSSDNELVLLKST